MAKLKPIITTQEKLDTIDIKEGQLICVKDSNSIYIDTDTERLEYTLPRVLNYLSSGASISIGGSNTIERDGCVILGSENTASSDKVFILGQKNIASGVNSVAEGQGNTASGICSHAEGQGNTASGQASHVQNAGNIASGKYSTALGTAAKAIGNTSLAFCGTAEGQSSIALLPGSTAQGDYSVAIGEGAKTTSSANSSIAIGAGAQANSPYSFVFGGGAKSEGNGYSVVLGNGSTSYNGAKIIGDGNTAYGSNTIALGNGINTHNSNVPVIGNGNVLPEDVTSAIIIGNHGGGDYLTEITNNCINIGFSNKIIGKGLAYGQGLKVTKDSEIAIGKYNLSNDDIVFSIGNGIDNDNRLNIFTIYNDGKVESSSFIGASITNWQSNYLYKINELVVYNNILYQCNINHTSLETFEENKWTILLSAKDDSFNFNDLSTAMTTGIQSGIRVIADEENERFNFEVTGIPAIAIDSDGYWTINGERGENPTKAQGNDGFTPSITTSEIENGVTVTIANKEGTISTNILNGEDGFSPSAKVSSIENGVNIEIIDKDGTTTANVLNGLDGITPHIDDLTKNWFIGETNTGVKAESSIEINADCAILYATFLASGWSETAPYTQTVLVNGINENNVPIVDISYSEDSSLWKNEYQSFSNLTKIETINGSIIGTCLNSKPIYDFTVKLKIAGDITYDTVISKEEFNTTIGNINTILASVTGGVE